MSYLNNKVTDVLGTRDPNPQNDGSITPRIIRNRKTRVLVNGTLVKDITKDNEYQFMPLLKVIRVSKIDPVRLMFELLNKSDNK